MKYLSNYETIQIELSTNCNAICPGCVRTDNVNYNSAKSTIPKGKSIEIDTLKRFFSDPSAQNIKTIDFCGTIDEPFMYPDFLELIQFLYDKNPDYYIKIHTNGGVKRPMLYQNVAKILGLFNRKGMIKFSLDGLEDTNHLYRHKVSWPTVIDNIKSLTGTKAELVWQFIKFPWNEHQEDDARTLASNLGFDFFYVRTDRSRASEVGIEKISNARSKNATITKEILPEEKLLSSINFNNEIECFFKENNMFFLSWDAKVWPCCFIPNTRYDEHGKALLLKNLLGKRYDKNFNSLHHFSLSQILEHPYFNKDIVESWNENSEHKKMSFRCYESCSKCKNKKPVADNFKISEFHK